MHRINFTFEHSRVWIYATNVKEGPLLDCRAKN